ncbi:hypothetical protein RhiirA5_447985 [Rhizophagus irregularis]|uniref:Uncharacterized protein n=1 Tax=Rhizophagus irregularis TaxID=588596 RepID=A0A2N0NAT7_9GLOM|nr:hypothetical protein RhiirA5_447985 [Rhizophagus irregularis]
MHDQNLNALPVWTTAEEVEVVNAAEVEEMTTGEETAAEVTTAAVEVEVMAAANVEEAIVLIKMV